MKRGVRLKPHPYSLLPTISLQTYSCGNALIRSASLAPHIVILRNNVFTFKWRLYGCGSTFPTSCEAVKLLVLKHFEKYFASIFLLEFW